jgi:hypothetical protein
MDYMFKRKTKLRQSRVPPGNQLIGYLGRLVKQKAKRVAYMLSSKLQRFNRRQIRMGLYSFLLLSVLVNSAIIVSAFQNPGGDIKITGKHQPNSLLDIRTKTRPEQNLRNYQQVLQLEKLLDSLQIDPEGKQQYELFIHTHPHFRDTLQLLKNLYSNR